MTDSEAVTRKYISMVADPATRFEDLQALFDEHMVWREMPNRFAPHGRTNQLAGAGASWQKGREAVRDQAYEIRSVVAEGGNVALQIRWSGTMAKELGPFPAGTKLSAELGIFLQIEGGKIVRQTDYPCYFPDNAGS